MSSSIRVLNLMKEAGTRTDNILSVDTVTGKKSTENPGERVSKLNVKRMIRKNAPEERGRVRGASFWAEWAVSVRRPATAQHTLPSE